MFHICSFSGKFPALFITASALWDGFFYDGGFRIEFLLLLIECEYMREKSERRRN